MSLRLAKLERLAFTLDLFNALSCRRLIILESCRATCLCALTNLFFLKEVLLLCRDPAYAANSTVAAAATSCLGLALGWLVALLYLLNRLTAGAFLF